MSKRMSRISGLLLRAVVGGLIVCGGVSFDGKSAFGQDKGYSIESAEESTTAPVVAPKDAFTNPNTKLSSSQFGTFDNVKAQALQSKPKLDGSKPEGTYAHDGRSMFRQAPKLGSLESGKLQPFAPNSLRAEDRPQPDDAPDEATKAPPIVVGDFQKSARRLPTLPKNPPTNPTTVQPKVAQVTFQDGGGFSQNRPQGGSTASRFDQSAGSRFGQQSSSNSSRLGGNTLQPRASQASAQPVRSQFGDSRSQLNPQRQPLAASANNRNSGQSFSQRNQSSGASPRNGRPGLRAPQQNRQPPAARMAALVQPTQPMRGTAGIAPGLSTKRASTGAKALLNGWVETNPELKLPGKRLKLHQFLAQPINGSRKDAINQYWITFTDMANHKLAVEQSQWLSTMSNPRQPADQAVLKAAQQAAQNRVLHTEIQLAKSQSILGDFLPNLRYNNGKSIPVLPADIPWVGKLNTKLKEYQSRGIVPARFNAIDEILPKARQLIVNRAEAVAAASEAAEQSKTAMRNGQTPVANVLEAARIKAKNQADFLSTVTGYNRAITDYVLSVRQDIYQPKRLASVLIGRKSVQPTLAKADKPQEDVEPSMNASTPKMRQISTGQRSNPSDSGGLQGKSAYQNDSNSNLENNSGLQQQTGSQQQSNSPFAAANANRPVAAKSQSSFEYGPTAKSAAATGFDPAKVREELPTVQSRPASNNSGYAGNSSGAGAGQNRTASRGGVGSRQPLGGSSRGGMGMGNSNTIAQPRTTGTAGQPSPFGQADTTQPPVSRFNNSASPGSTGGVNNMNSGNKFPPSRSSVPSETAPMIPKSNPFGESSKAAPDPTAGATTSPQISDLRNAFFAWNSRMLSDAATPALEFELQVSQV